MLRYACEAVESETGNTRGASFGARLRRLRGDAGLTQEELAARAGLTAKAISALERGERKRPYPHTVRTLADALELPEEERAALFSAVSRRGDSASAPSYDAHRGRPGYLEPLIGREREAEVALLLLRRPNARLLTLTGPGGVGKTRLGLQVARDAEGEFPDGVIFVPLAPLGDPGMVVAAIAQALGAREASGPSPLGNLVATIRDRRMLLVLDNFEHVIEAASGVTELLIGCPRLKVLVTSRAPLRVRGEQEYHVPPLEFPSRAQTANADADAVVEDLAGSPAVRLFVERAGAVTPGFSLTPENAGTIARICARLDGLPLAIELAAARVRLLSPGELLDRLERSLRILTGGPRDLPARQRTIRDAIAWSHDLLGAGEKTLFRRLSVFAVGGTLGAIEAVCEDESDDALDRLATLLDNSLVHREAADGDGEPRIGLLEPVRQYAREHLEESGEEERFLLRHADYYHALALRAGPLLMRRDQVSWLESMWREQYNLLAAMRFLLDHGDLEKAVSLTWALWRYWWVTGLLRESRRWMEEALASGSDLSPERRAQANLTIGTMAWSEGETALALPALEEGLRLSRETDDARSQAIGHMLLGLMDVVELDGEQARKRFEESLRLFRVAGQGWGEALTLNYLGLTPLLKGEHESARRCFEESLAAARATGDRIAAHQALLNLGSLALEQGNHDLAAEHLSEGLSLAAEVRDILNAAYFVKALGQVAALRGRSSPAVRLLAAAETAFRATGSRPYRYLPDEVLQGRLLAATREELGEVAFEEEWKRGLAMTLERAIAEALEVAESRPHHKNH